MFIHYISQSMNDGRQISDREYLTSLIESRFRELASRCDSIEEATRTAFVTSEKAIMKAEIATEHRFEGVNEFRAQLSDQQITLITRKEVEALLNTIRETMNSMQMQINELREGTGELIRREHFEVKLQEVNKAIDTRQDWVNERLRDLDRFRWISIGISAGAGGFAGWISRIIGH